MEPFFSILACFWKPLFPGPDQPQAPPRLAGAPEHQEPGQVRRVQEGGAGQGREQCQRQRQRQCQSQQGAVELGQLGVRARLESFKTGLVQLHKQAYLSSNKLVKYGNTFGSC